LIFQGFYKDEQRYHCDHHSLLVDTREISGSEYGEHAVIQHLLTEFELGEFFGYFSWKADLKLGGAFRRLLFSIEDLQSNYDFVFVNAMVFGRAFFRCPFKQGEWSGHHGMLECARELGLVEEFDYYAMNHFIVGNRDFWSFFLDFHRDLDSKMASASGGVDIRAASSGFYVRNPGMPMSTFIRERALNNVMKRSGLSGFEFKLPLDNFCQKYSKALGAKTSQIHSLYQNNDLTNEDLAAFGFGGSESIKLLTSLDDPEMRLI